MKASFGTLPGGEPASLYTIAQGRLTASVTDFGGTLVALTVDGVDVLLGFDDPKDYISSTSFLGALVGRNANRVGGASFTLNGEKISLGVNDGSNSLHSGPDCWHLRMWQVENLTENAITLRLDSPHGDQGFPGNARITVTYRIENNGLYVIYDGICDRDTVFNPTQHAYFNLAGHDRPERAMEQILTLNSTHFTPATAESIATGEIRSVEGTPMDFRSPKAIGRDIDADYECLNLQGGFDHNYVVEADPCAILTDPYSGRTMAVHTDRPGVQFYAGNYLAGEVGKGGAVYGKRSGICLETQFWPDSVNHPEWKQPFVKAGETFHSETVYQFK